MKRTLLILSLCWLTAVGAVAAGTMSAVKISGTLPVLHINTERGVAITSKVVYSNATYWLDTMGKADVEAIGSESSPLPMQIRGRGHSSWRGKKKPYKIKLDSKQPMMGMPANKHWALLSGSDYTLAAFSLDG